MSPRPALHPQSGGTVLDVVTIETTSLGDRSYLATDGTVAVVVDPQRDHDRVLDVARDRGLRITHVLETHVHNDYVTGGLALAREVGADYCLNGADEVSFDRTAVADGDVVRTGGLLVRAIATPGHTYTHLSYAVSVADDSPGAGGARTVVFTGGSLLHGATGRPDLLGPEHTTTLARLQHASARRLVAELPDDTEVYPTHGFGSFCAATPTSSDASTIGSQRSANPALTQEVDDWVEHTIASLSAYPAYYAHMAPANAAGPGPVDLSAPEPASPTELRRRIDAGEWVVDLRDRTSFAAGHLGGSFSFGQDGSFVTYLGWLLPWGTPVTLLAGTPEALEEAQRDLARIGIDRPAAAATGDVRDWSGGAPLSAFAVADFPALARASTSDGEAAPFVLDVRRDDERARGGIAGSVHVPLHSLLQRLDEVPAGRRVWVHCASGYRSSIAAAVLDRAGRDVVFVDDSYDNAEAAGLPIEENA